MTYEGQRGAVAVAVLGMLSAADPVDTDLQRRIIDCSASLMDATSRTNSAVNRPVLASQQVVPPVVIALQQYSPVPHVVQGNSSGEFNTLDTSTDGSRGGSISASGGERTDPSGTGSSASKGGGERNMSRQGEQTKPQALKGAERRLQEVRERPDKSQAPKGAGGTEPKGARHQPTGESVAKDKQAKDAAYWARIHLARASQYTPEANASYEAAASARMQPSEPQADVFSDTSSSSGKRPRAEDKGQTTSFTCLLAPKEDEKKKKKKKGGS